MPQDAQNILVNGQNFFQLDINHMKKYLMKTELIILLLIYIRESECDLFFNSLSFDKLDETNKIIPRLN